MNAGNAGKVLQLVRPSSGGHPGQVFHWVITLQWPAGKLRWSARTWTGTAEISGHTRSEVYEELFSRCLAKAGRPDAIVVFFSLEPEVLR